MGILDWTIYRCDLRSHTLSWIEIAQVRRGQCEDEALQMPCVYRLNMANYMNFYSKLNTNVMFSLML